MSFRKYQLLNGLQSLKKVEKFHGHKVIKDDDLQNVLNNDVLEISSNGDLVLRHYDNDGYEDEPYYLDPLSDVNNIMRGVQKQIGSKRFLISESAVDLIISLQNS